MHRKRRFPLSPFFAFANLEIDDSFLFSLQPVIIVLTQQAYQSDANTHIIVLWVALMNSVANLDIKRRITQAIEQAHRNHVLCVQQEPMGIIH